MNKPAFKLWVMAGAMVMLALMIVCFGPSAIPVRAQYSGGNRGSSSAALPTGLTYVAPTFTVSAAGSGNGQVALSGNTSGTCTMTVDATGTTITVPCTISAGNGLTMTAGIATLPAGGATTPSLLFGSGASVGFYGCTTAQICVSQGTSNPMITILSGKMQMGNAQAFGWAATAASNGSVDLTLCRQGTGVVEIGSGTACGTSGSIIAQAYQTAANCANSGGTCAAASSGSVSIAAAATTVTVATTAVTANSVIEVTEDSSLGTKLSVTCNTTTGRTYSVTARTAGTSFVITAGAAPATNPACLNYTILN